MALKRSDLKVGAVIKRSYTYTITSVGKSYVEVTKRSGKSLHNFEIRDLLKQEGDWKLVNAAPTPKKVAKTDPAARAQELWDAL